MLKSEKRIHLGDGAHQRAIEAALDGAAQQVLGGGADIARQRALHDAGFAGAQTGEDFGMRRRIPWHRRRQQREIHGRAALQPERLDQRHQGFGFRRLIQREVKLLIGGEAAENIALGDGIDQFAIGGLEPRDQIGRYPLAGHLGGKPLEHLADLKQLGEAAVGQPRDAHRAVRHFFQRIGGNKIGQRFAHRHRTGAEAGGDLAQAHHLAGNESPDHQARPQPAQNLILDPAAAGFGPVCASPVGASGCRATWHCWCRHGIVSVGATFFAPHRGHT